MTDEEICGWFFDTSPRVHGPYAHLGQEMRDLIRGAYVYKVSRLPDVVEAIRAHRAQADELDAKLRDAA